MNDIDVFVIDDDFDPLADLELVEDGEGQETDYLPPIPDADKSVVPEAVELPAGERIERLLAGIPGQQFRILSAVELCSEPKTITETAEAMDAAYPNCTSVYSSQQIIMLLERAGALERVAAEADEASENAAASADVSPEEDFITVVPAAPVRVVATRAGLDAVETRVGERVVRAMLEEEPLYLPLYQTILEQCAAEGGCATKDLDALIDVDPLCVEPRRFCGYFRGRLEGVGALVWRDAWNVTDLGAKVLASDIFNH